MSAARRYLAPVAVILVLLGAWELAARWDWISNALNIEDFLVPAPSDIATSLWEDRSLLARRRLGHPPRGPAGLPLRARRRARLRGRPAPLGDPAARLLSAARRLPDDPAGGDRRRSWSSGSASGSAPSWC